jgi:hypothetical protein
MRSSRFAGLLFCFALCCASLHAQASAGSVAGTVTDPSGGVVSGAAITVTNMDTNISVKTTTNSTGNYVVTPLEVGRYSVAVEAPGFKKFVHSDIRLDVQDRLRVDAKLEVGALTDTVAVAADAPRLQTETSDLGQVVESQRIVDLPLNGRFFTRLAVLTAGTAPTPTGARDENTGGFSANGVRPYRQQQHVRRPQQPAELCNRTRPRRHRRIQSTNQLHERRVRPFRWSGAQRDHQVRKQRGAWHGL